MRKYLTLNFVFLLVQLVSCNIFLLYDVFQSEGFNLRRDVYIRVVNVLRLLREPSKLPPGVGVAFSHSDTTDLNWTLVLPPWGPLPHWFAASHGSASDSETSWQQFVGLRWSKFFDIPSLNHVVPVIEFEEFQSILSKSHPQSANTRPQIDLVLNLIRQYENLRTDRQRGVRFCPPDLLRSHKIANDPIPISLFQANFITNQTELVSPIASRYECITGDLEPVYLAPFLHQIVHNKSLFTTKPVWSIFLGGAESIIHGLWSEWSQEYWTARRSMVFASHLRQIADQFRTKYLASNDHSDRTLMPKSTQSQLTGSAWMHASWPLAPALGGPFLAVHWRCGDFVSHLTGRWNYTPSPALAAKQIAEAAQNQKLDVVYLATDASESDVKELEDELAPITVVRFVPSDSDWSHLGPGEIAIIDQWICAHARFFMGTSPSTFTFRITEERTIMGFTPESTFNTLCASGQARYYTNGQDQVDGETDNCEALTFWSIKLEPEYTVPSATSSLPLRSQDEL